MQNPIDKNREDIESLQDDLNKMDIAIMMTDIYINWAELSEDPARHVNKFREESNEFLENPSPEEMADCFIVLRAWCLKTKIGMAAAIINKIDDNISKEKRTKG